MADASTANMPIPHPITASMLYDLVTCPHRVTMDLFADPNEMTATRYCSTRHFSQQRIGGLAWKMIPSGTMMVDVFFPNAIALAPSNCILATGTDNATERVFDPSLKRSIETGHVPPLRLWDINEQRIVGGASPTALIRKPRPSPMVGS